MNPLTDTAPAAELVAGEVRALMARRRLSQADLAAAAGKTPAYWSRRLTAAVPLDVVDLAALAHVLGVTVRQLVAPLDPEPDDVPMSAAARPKALAARDTHEDTTAAPYYLGQNLYVQPRCSCGWLDGTAYRTSDPDARGRLVDLARDRWRAHAHDVAMEA